MTKAEETVINDINQVPIIIRREIEALIAVPILKAFSEEFGKERTLLLFGKVLEKNARQAGIFLKDAFGDNSMQTLPKLNSVFMKGGALEIEMVESTPVKTRMNVTHCKYADMYKRLGFEDWGYALSCARDSALFAGFNPDMRFTRKQTIMEGADYCDFCLSMDDE